MLGTDLLTLLGALATVAGPATVPGEAAATTAKSPMVACTLGSAEKRERKSMLERELVPNIQEVEEQANGYVLWFDRADGRLATIASFVELESRCCAFLDFEIRVASAGDRIALVLSGPEGTKQLLKPLIEKRGGGE
ncbi:MAG TPA: hypothetical protein VHR17_04795 [Thermoanaerobaculia bacterium]|nr:hypothetical protein [Thermoanaerobaculia bacterium]